jgi:hypothetical protein
MSKSKPQRISEKLIRDLKTAGMERINQGLANPFRKGDISIREMTEMITRTDAWKNVLNELKTRPRIK